MKLRGFLESKNGEFRDTLEVLVHPDTWKELTPGSVPLRAPDAQSTSSLRVTKNPLRSGSCSIILRA
jgi:hypothetical protein